MKMKGFAGLNPSYELQRRDLPVGRFVDGAVESFFRIFRKIFVAT